MKKITASALIFLFSLTLVAQKKEIVIIHTNDTHSQIEPYQDKKMGDVGGILRRDAAISEIRSRNKNNILVDAGDFVQGTPYFNFFKGEVEIEMMNRLGYEVATLGNHEFDNGLDMLAEMLKKAKFTIVSSNYDFTGHELENLVKKTTTKEIDGIKIGFLGIGINPKGLIDAKNFKGGTYLNPIETMNKYAAELKADGCDYIVVISHSGFFKDEEERDDDDEDKFIGDIQLAKNSKDVDLIVGGHTHTFLDGCTEVKNQNGKKVMITQSGSRGGKIGKINIEFNKN